MYRGFVLGVLTVVAFGLAFNVLLRSDTPTRDASCVPLYDQTGLECCQ